MESTETLNQEATMNTCGLNALKPGGDGVKVGTWPGLDRQCGSPTKRGDGSPWAGEHNCTRPVGHEGEHECPCGLKGWRP